MKHTVLIALSLLALAGCRPAQPVETPAKAEPSQAALEAAADKEMADAVVQERQAQLARAAADPVVGVIERAELCLHFGGEEGYDAERRAQIDKAFEDNKCDTVVADGDALKAAHPEAVARIDTALEPLRM